MSCWVVPSLAADIWQIPLELLWRRIRAGEIAIRQENGFTFVDVAPHGPTVTRPNLLPDQRPSTYCSGMNLVESEPRRSESGASAPLADGRGSLVPPRDDEDEMGPSDETASVNLGDWRAARRRNARLRVPPLKWRLSA